MRPADQRSNAQITKDGSAFLATLSAHMGDPEAVRESFRTLALEQGAQGAALTATAALRTLFIDVMPHGRPASPARTPRPADD